MQLPDALQQLAARFGLPADDLHTFAYEDEHTGWDKGNGAWPTGSLWRVEGQVLYALIRVLKPATVLELGTWHGCSTTHMLEALRQSGHKSQPLVSVDNNMEASGPDQIGHMIPDHLRLSDFWQHVDDDILHYVTTTKQTFDFIFEDGFHDPAQVQAVWQHAARLLNPGGMIVSHDAMHYIVGDGIRQGITAAGFDDVLLLDIAPSDCGLAVWRQAGELKPSITFTDEQVHQFQAIASKVHNGDNYDTWTLAQLRAEAKRRELTVKGRKKSTFIEALRASDGEMV